MAICSGQFYCPRWNRRDNEYMVYKSTNIWLMRDIPTELGRNNDVLGVTYHQFSTSSQFRKEAANTSNFISNDDKNILRDED